MNVSSYDICILIFIEGERIARGKNGSFFSLSGPLPSLFLLSSKWAPIPTLFRMITDRYNKNGNIGPLCARQLATGMNTREIRAVCSSLLLLCTCSSNTATLLHTFREKCASNSASLGLARNREVSDRIWSPLMFTDCSLIHSVKKK